MALPGETTGGEMFIKAGKKTLPLKVLKSHAGYYLGYFHPEEGPWGRESDYFRSAAEAEAALQEWKSGFSDVGSRNAPLPNKPGNTPAVMKGFKQGTPDMGTHLQDQITSLDKELDIMDSKDYHPNAAAARNALIMQRNQAAANLKKILKRGVKGLGPLAMFGAVAAGDPAEAAASMVPGWPGTDTLDRGEVPVTDVSRVQWDNKGKLSGY